MQFTKVLCLGLLSLASAGPRARQPQTLLAVDGGTQKPIISQSSNFWLKSKGKEPKCNDKKVVDSGDDKFLACPKDCPVWADDRGDSVDCNFECVAAEPKACIKVNPKEPIPDEKMGICRACLVNGCDVCTTKGEDTCAKCQPGFTLKDGKCENDNKYYWYALGGFCAFMFLFFCAYMIDLFTRPIVNEAGLKHALKARSLSKPRMPPDESGARQLWPVSTNLMKEVVAGVGTQLQFNFQAAVIVWALAVAVSWALLAYTVDDALFILGTRRAKTARQNCILVAWGFETQHRLMWTKVDFMIVLYIASFLLCMALGVYQLRVFQKTDQANSTHKDFAARIRNMPLMEGTENVEEQLKERIETATGQKVVGVSVCWDFVEHEEDVMELLESQLVEKDAALHPEPVAEEEPEEPQSWFAKMERSTMLPAMASEANKIVAKGEATAEERAQSQECAGDDEGDQVADVKEVDVLGILKSIRTCPDAYAVFETETARDAAVDTSVQSGGIEFNGKTITLNASRVEPQSVQWPNCANTDLWFKAKRILMGLGVICLGLGVWVVAFYLPYAWFSLTFNYSYGQEPGLMAGVTFSMVVVAGNLLMYQVCSITAVNAKFIYIDDREVCYMLCYCFACTFNVVLDLCCTYKVAYKINVGLRQKTYDGHLLENIQTFAGRFESYAMQRLLANNLWAYAFPATFLIGFVAEPIATIYAPYKVACQIIGSQPSVGGFMAEQLMPALIAGTEYDLSRYADVLLNIMIAVLIFFFPGGFNIQMFGALGVCHIIIYVLDHYKVLRCIKAVEFAGKMVDWWAQLVLCLPTALMLSCLVFKANCEPDYFCLNDGDTVIACGAAFFAHVFLHTLCLMFVVPMFGTEASGDDADNVTYRSVCERLACSWFTSNPIYCLRSQYIYKHSPACTFYSPGKEHVMELNEELGFFFDNDAAPEEDFNAKLVDTDALKANFDKLKEKLKKDEPADEQKNGEGAAKA